MSKKGIIGTIGFIILLFGIVAGTLLVNQNQDFREKAAPATQLSITPSSQTKNINNSFTLTVVANTGENKVIGADLVISYDKDAFEILSVSKGSGISSFENVINSKIDASTGKITYSIYTLNSTNAVSGNNIEMLTINAKVSNSAQSGTYNFTFGNQTVLAGSGESQNVVVSSQQATVIVSGNSQVQATPTSTSNPTATATSAGGGNLNSGNNNINPTSTPKNTSSPTKTATPFPIPVTGVSFSTIMSLLVSFVAIAGSLMLIF
jgi:hypothetical protein